MIGPISFPVSGQTRFGHGNSTPDKKKTEYAHRREFRRLKKAGRVPAGMTEDQFVEQKQAKRSGRKWRK